MEHQRAVRLDRTKQFAEEHKLTSYSMSARTGESVSICCSLQSIQFSDKRVSRLLSVLWNLSLAILVFGSVK